MYTATFDKRVKAVVVQVPSTISSEFRRARDPEGWDRAGALCLRDRVERYKTGVVNYIKVVAPEGEPCALPGQKAYEALMAQADAAPSWRNQMTVESLERTRQFDPVRLVHWVAPAALLFLPAEKDSLIPIEAVKETYERAAKPKALSVLPIEHFEIYYEPWLSEASGAAVDWFDRYL